MNIIKQIKLRAEKDIDDFPKEHKSYYSKLLLIQEMCFLLAVIALPFTNIPLKIRFLGFLGEYGNKLGAYPLLIGILSGIYLEFKTGEFFIRKRQIKYYAVLYFGITVISLLLGLFKYPYYNELIPSERLLGVCRMLPNFSVDSMMGGWLFLRFTKHLIIDFVFGVGVAYWVYCLFYKRYRYGIMLMIKGLIASSFVVVAFSIIEMIYFGGGEWAENFLAFTRPLLHSIKEGRGWWPPLFWPKLQLRSVFPEPSFFGSFAALILPFLLGRIVEGNNKMKLFVFTYILLFLSFMTMARTTVFLCVGTVLLFISMVLFKTKKMLWQSVVVILLLVLASFSQTIFMNNIVQGRVPKTVIDNTAMKSNALEESVDTIATNNSRSNGARFGIAVANFEIFKKNICLGVGPDLLSAYVTSNLPQFAYESPELKSWVKQQNEEGILKSGIPKLENIISMFAERGIFGASVYFLPILCVGVTMLKKIREKSIENIVLLVGVIVQTISGFSMYYSTLGALWIVLGLALAEVDSDKY